MAAPQPAIVRDPGHLRRYMVFVPMSTSATGPWAKFDLAESYWDTANEAAIASINAYGVQTIEAGYCHTRRVSTVANGRLSESAGGWTAGTGIQGNASGHFIRYSAETEQYVYCDLPANHDYVSIMYEQTSTSTDTEVQMLIGASGCAIGDAVATGDPFRSGGAGGAAIRLMERVIPITADAADRRIFFRKIAEAGGAWHENGRLYLTQVASWRSDEYADPRTLDGTDGLWYGNDIIGVILRRLTGTVVGGTLTYNVGTGYTNIVVAASTFTITDDGAADTGQAGGYLEFDTTGNRYEIVTRTSATDIHVVGDASAETGTFAFYWGLRASVGSTKTIHNNQWYPHGDGWRLCDPNTPEPIIQHEPAGGGGQKWTCLSGPHYNAAGSDLPLSITEVPKLYVDDVLIGDMTDSAAPMPMDYGEVQVGDRITVIQAGTAGAETLRYVTSFGMDGMSSLMSVIWGGAGTMGTVYGPSPSNKWSGRIMYMRVPNDLTAYANNAAYTLYSSRSQNFISGYPYALELEMVGPGATTFSLANVYKTYTVYDLTGLPSPGANVVWAFGGRVRVIRVPGTGTYGWV
jgi:hypothetical protein